MEGNQDKIFRRKPKIVEGNQNKRYGRIPKILDGDQNKRKFWKKAKSFGKKTKQNSGRKPR